MVLAFVPVNAPPSWMLPENVVLVLSFPTVSWLAPKKISPSPLMEPTVTPGALRPLMSRKPLPKASIRAVPAVESA